MYSLIPSLRTVTCTDTQLPFHAFQTPVRVIPRGLKEGGREACRASGESAPKQGSSHATQVTGTFIQKIHLTAGV